MNRRDFAKKTLGALGLSMLPLSQAISKTADAESPCHLGNTLKTSCGMQLTLVDQQWATASQDHKQFILTFAAPCDNASLATKIYDVKDQRGRAHQIYMTPVAEARLQAGINWRPRAQP